MLLLQLSFNRAVSAALASLPLQFEKPVLVAHSPSDSTHAWFPEGGAVVGSAGAVGQAVLTAVRFNRDGGPPLPNHTDECLVSWDGGRTYSHFAWTTYVQGTPTFLDGAGVLHGAANFNTSRNKDGMITARALRFTAHANKTITQAEQPPGTVTYEGFPFPIGRTTYASAMIPLDKSRTTLAQTVAFSFKMNEIGGADENLAGFKSTDGGRHWQFQQVIALRNETFPPSVRNQTHSNRTWEYKYYVCVLIPAPSWTSAATLCVGVQSRDTVSVSLSLCLFVSLCLCVFISVWLSLRVFVRG